VTTLGGTTKQSSMKYVFLDRDGVINLDGEIKGADTGYITNWEDFEFVPGVLEAIKAFNAAGYSGVVISNQQCVGKGLMSQEELSSLTVEMIAGIEDGGGKIAGAFFCTHLKEDNCDCRKPRTGLFKIAKKDLDIKSLEGQYFIGDSERDIQAGQSAGLKTILVLTGKSTRQDADKFKYKPDHICKDLLEAHRIIVGAAHAALNKG
jgi:D-glycero-D-manno-heptose 1,7-bisphosphate phosphatase